MSTAEHTCERCACALTADYFSDERCNATGIGVCLCEACAKYTATLSDQAFAAGDWRRDCCVYHASGGPKKIRCGPDRFTGYGSTSDAPVKHVLLGAISLLNEQQACKVLSALADAAHQQQDDIDATDEPTPSMLATLATLLAVVDPGYAALAALAELPHGR
jgi:hypothetical protein